MAKEFRIFAARTGADRHALAAIERASANRSPLRLDAITVPVLVLAGSDDTLIQPPQQLAVSLPNARLELIPGDHLSAVGEPAFKAAILRWLAER